MKPTDPRGATILILTAERALRGAAGTLLAQHGHHVFDAGSGRAGAVALRVCDPDLVVVDDPLPDTGGVGWIGARRQEGDRRPMILLTGGGDTAAFEMMTRALAVERRVRKPVEAAALVAALQEVQGAPRGGQASAAPTPPGLASFDAAEVDEAEATWIVPALHAGDGERE
jgi:DNA-binding response OmpR family regulator